MNMFSVFISLMRVNLSIMTGWLFLEKVVEYYDWNTFILWIIVIELFWANTYIMVTRSSDQ